MRKFISFVLLILTEQNQKTNHWLSGSDSTLSSLCLVFVCRLEALTCPVWGPAWWWPRSGRAFPSLIPSPNSSRTSGSPPELSAPPLAQGSMWPSVYRWGFPGLFFIYFLFLFLIPGTTFQIFIPRSPSARVSGAQHLPCREQLAQDWSSFSHFFSAAKWSHRCSEQVQHESELFLSHQALFMWE